MKVYYATKRLPHMNKPMVAIGVFDGVHKGHQKLLNKLVESARRKKKKAVVITFTPHPYKILHAYKIPPMLFSLPHRLKILGYAGIDLVFVLRFTKKMSLSSPEDFLRRYLVKELNVGELFMGANFKLGKGRKGGFRRLMKIAAKYDFRLNVIKCKKIGRSFISSTLIRKLIMEGKLNEASVKLGRKVSLLGTVVRGDRRGRVIGFPTANLDLHHEAVPPAGVYAVIVKYKEKEYKAILNIGFRPTFKSPQKERTVEVHIFDFKKNIYGANLEIIFIKKIRDERHFRNREHLRVQIQRDQKTAQTLLKNRQLYA